MTTARNLHIDASRDFAFAAQWLDAEGDPHDLSTATISAQIRARYPDAAGEPGPVAEFTCTGELSGWFHLTMTGEQTAAIPPGTYVYDVLVVTAAGARPPLLRGSVTVSPAVTIEDES